MMILRRGTAGEEQFRQPYLAGGAVHFVGQAPHRQIEFFQPREQPGVLKRRHDPKQGLEEMMDDERRVLTGAWLLAQGNTIAALGNSSQPLPPADTVIDA